MTDLICDYLLVVRFEPRSTFLDERGHWAGVLKEVVALKDWKIDENRIDFFEEGKPERFFVSFQDMGFQAQLRRDERVTPKIQSFLKQVFALANAKQPLKIKRIGVRMRFLYPTDLTFPDLLSRYLERYVSPNARLVSGLRGELVDIGAPLNFKDNDGFFNTQCGPMKKPQMRDFFERGEEVLPTVGLFYDIDHFTLPTIDFDATTTFTCIDRFSSNAVSRGEFVRQLILGADE